jgi:hypothetical protein
MFISTLPLIHVRLGAVYGGRLGAVHWGMPWLTGHMVVHWLSAVRIQQGVCVGRVHVVCRDGRVLPWLGDMWGKWWPLYDALCGRLRYARCCLVLVHRLQLRVFRQVLYGQRRGFRLYRLVCTGVHSGECWCARILVQRWVFHLLWQLVYPSRIHVLRGLALVPTGLHRQLYSRYACVVM